MLMWHQHQPRYPLDEAGVVTRPWVRVHATKDYYDMAAMVADYSGLNITFNLTPSVLLQLEELAAGTKDAYWVVSEVAAADLDDGEKRFLMERFFDTNPRVIDRFARYRELADARAAAGGPSAPLDTFSTDDYRDLQVLFNLAWTDPGFLEDGPLAALVAKSSGFAEEDKAIVFAEHLRIVREVVPLHARLWREGQIEVTTTPLAHPILPLIADTSLATVGDPAAVLPSNRFRQVPDAEMHIVEGLDTAERMLGRRPSGMWPGEGAVAELIMWLFSKNGVRWVASGEEVLAGSLGIGSFTRDSTDLVREADLLYRPRLADVTNREPVAMFFRDGLLSDLIGFEYSQSPAEDAADDFMARLEAIRAHLASLGPADPDRPYVVSVILDGENAWEHYDNDGRDFLDALYRRLSQSTTISTITPSEYLDTYGPPEIVEEVWPGAWFQPNYATWIGEREEATAWDYLFAVRRDLAEAQVSGEYSETQIATALRSMLFAEGSDWFWFLGSDQDSGQDSYFDGAFRALLGGVYDALGEPRPPFIDVPIIPATPVAADRAPRDLLNVDLDGSISAGEWDAAGRYDFDDAAIDAVEFGYDPSHLYLKVAFGEAAPEGLDVFVGAPPATRTRGASLDGTVLGFAAGALMSWDAAEPAASCVYSGLPPVGREDLLAACRKDPAGAGDGFVELALPLEDLGLLQAGDRLVFRIVARDAGAESGLLPAGGPALAVVPDISNVVAFLDVDDPSGDDHGPGSYTYPTDEVFTAGSYDLVGFEAGTEGEDVVFTFEFATTIQNPWGSPNGLAVQTIDVYVDKDPGAGTGARILLPGRNAALQAGNGWEYGITVEGWQSAIYEAEAEGAIAETTPSFKVAVLGDQGKVIVRVPVGLLGGGDPASWSYAVAVLSQEGFPSPGVRRVRDVAAAAGQWVAGGGPGDVNHTRIFDLAWPEPGFQETLLSTYPPAPGALDALGPDDFPQVPMVNAVE
jgi:alpha-amylase/alpha-mannosidase (GH57 family)